LLVRIYVFFMLAIKWSTLSPFTKFTPKLSTTKVKVIGLDLWHHRPGVLIHSEYPNDASFWRRHLLERMPACGKPYTALLILIYTQPSNASFLRLYCSIIHEGNNKRGIFMYSKYSNTAARFFLMSRHMYLAFSMLITLFQCNISVSMSAICTVALLVTLVVDQITPPHDLNAVGIVFLRTIIKDWICISSISFSASACAGIISSCIITNIAFVPILPILLQPCATPPKCLPNAFCHTPDIARLCINFCRLRLSVR
jgi:hypothetical protein